MALRQFACACTRFPFGLRHLLLRCVGAGPGRFHAGRTRLGSGDCLIVLLLRNFLFVDQLLVAAEIVLRLHVVGFSLLQLRLGRLELLFCNLDAGARAVHVRFAGRNLAAGIHGRNRHIHAGRNCRGLRIFEIRFRPLVGNLIVRRINFDQHRPGLHVSGCPRRSV